MAIFPLLEMGMVLKPDNGRMARCVRFGYLVATRVRWVLRVVLALAAIGLSPLTAADDDAADDGWSADVLRGILSVEPVRTDAQAAAAAPASSPERVLHTYHLTQLRVGEGGRTQNVLAILAKLLPPGSSIKPDVPANSLHILTTVTAHQAAWDYLSAVDVPGATAKRTGATIPEDVQLALKRLATVGDQSAQIVKVLGALKSDLSNSLAAIDARQRRQVSKLVLGAVAFAGLLLMSLLWMLRRRPALSRTPDATATAVALVPEQLTTALMPVHDRMRSDMLGLLNEVAIKLQAQHGEQQKLVREQQQQLETARVALAEERRQFISEAGSMVVQAVERVDATTARLAKQQDKVAELVDELQTTVRELDETKDSLRRREVELEQERAKIAALSLLLEEGGVLGAPVGPNGSGGGTAVGHSDPAIVGRPVPRFPSCTNPAPSPASPKRLTIASVISPQIRFQFLPPDHPEM